MRTVYEAENIFDAMLVKHALEAAGIPAFVSGMHLSGAIGELPMAGLMRVLVPASAGAEADRIVATLDLGRHDVRDADESDPLPFPGPPEWGF